MRDKPLPFEPRRPRHGDAAPTLPDPEVGPCTVRISSALTAAIRADLRRPHAHAHERVGFVSAASGEAANGERIILLTDYSPVPDEDYVESDGVGACIGRDAIRRAMEQTLTTKRGIFHVHLHDHPGRPVFSAIDRKEQPRLVPSFAAVTPEMPHGMLLISADVATSWVWLPGQATPVTPRRTVIVGSPLRVTDDTPSRSREQDWFARQSFLGPRSSEHLGATRIGIVGYGGGGSHLGLQAVHLGLHRQRVFDADHVTETNHNRLVGGVASDIRAKSPKTDVAMRVIKGVDPDADVVVYPARWQEHAAALRGCDVILGCVDTFAARYELEVFSRRWGIPYIDIGMDVRQVDDQPPRMAGQVILSMPGGPCITCLGFLSPERLAEEAAKYGDTGGRPQVIWPNGVLASTAIGVLVDLVTGWTRQTDRVLYYSYDGNAGTITPHVRVRYLADAHCPHYDPTDQGDPVFVSL